MSLAAGHVGVCEFGVEALWQGSNVFVESHGFQHRVDAFRGGARVGEGEVIAQRAGQGGGFLFYVGEVRADFVGGEPRVGGAVEAEFSVFGLDEVEHGGEHGGFSGAGGPDDGGVADPGHGEAHPIKNGGAAWGVSGCYLVEFHYGVAAFACRRRGVGVGAFEVDVFEFLDAAGRGHAGLQPGDAAADLFDGSDDAKGVEEECHECGHGHVPEGDAPGAGAQDNHEGYLHAGHGGCPGEGPAAHRDNALFPGFRGQA